jgi:hypothetical protein
LQVGEKKKSLSFLCTYDSSHRHPKGGKRKALKQKPSARRSRERGFPMKLLPPTRVRCGGGNPGILPEGSRGRSLQCKTEHRARGLPAPNLPGSASGCRALHAGRHPSSRPRTTAHPPGPSAGPEGRSNLGPEGDGEQEVHMLQRRNSPSPTPTPPHPTPGPGQPGLGAPPAARTGLGSPPHIGAPRPKFTRVLLGTTSPGPAIPPGPGRAPDWDSTPRASRSDGSRSGDVAGAGSPGLLEQQLPGSQVSAWASSALCGSDCATPPPVRSLPREKTPNSSLPGTRARLGSTPPGQPTLCRSRAPGTPPRRGANSSRDTKMSRRVTGQPPPRPHAQRRPHTLPPRRAAPRDPGDSPSLSRREPEARAGPGQTQYGRAPQLLPWLPAAASGTPRREQAVAAAVAAAAAPHPPPPHPSRLLASSPPPRPAAMTTRRQGAWPRPSFRPASRSPPLPRPASYQGGGRPSELSSCRRVGGKVASGRVERARKAKRGDAEVYGAGRAGGKMKSPRLSPGRTYGRATEARRGCWVDELARDARVSARDACAGAAATARTAPWLWKCGDREAFLRTTLPSSDWSAVETLCRADFRGEMGLWNQIQILLKIFWDSVSQIKNQ